MRVNAAGEMLRELCALEEAGGRTLDRILKVVRTVGDLGRAEMASAKHVAEAVQYAAWIETIGDSAFWRWGREAARACRPQRLLDGIASHLGVPAVA
jgi:Magnesium chelatase, subunit ChlI C-terminal